MSEFLVTSDVSSGLVKAGHHTKRLLLGKPDDIRPKLLAALEQLRYQVLDEHPVKAKRLAARQVTGKLYSSTVHLSVGLRASSATATLATFDYEVSSSSMYKGDHTTIEREVDALVALVNRTVSLDVCQACGIPQQSDSQYCRVCGAPAVTAQPAELEVLRLNAETRYGHRANITGGSLLVASWVIGLAMILLGTGKAINVGWALLIMGQISGLCTLLFGNYIVHQALNPKPTPAAGKAAPVLQYQSMTPLQDGSTSVTEGTTELLTGKRTTRQFDLESQTSPQWRSSERSE